MKTYLQEVLKLQGDAGRCDITPLGVTWTDHDGITYSRHMVEARHDGVYVRGFVDRVESEK